MKKKIQAKWREGYVLGHDCIALSDDHIVMAYAGSMYDPNNGQTTVYWRPFCDTTVAGMQKYEEDLWTQVDEYHGAFEFEGQKIVFGDGGMGNEGHVASVTPDNDLNWSIFFTISNPIMRAEMKGRDLICYGETGFIATINIDDITKISVTHRDSHNAYV